MSTYAMSFILCLSIVTAATFVFLVNFFTKNHTGCAGAMLTKLDALTLIETVRADSGDALSVQT